RRSQNAVGGCQKYAFCNRESRPPCCDSETGSASGNLPVLEHFARRHACANDVVDFHASDRKFRKRTVSNSNLKSTGPRNHKIHRCELFRATVSALVHDTDPVDGDQSVGTGRQRSVLYRLDGNDFIAADWISYGYCACRRSERISALDSRELPEGCYPC